eukprot:366260-Chlamydomonas_euryale.AAC.31
MSRAPRAGRDGRSTLREPGQRFGGVASEGEHSNHPCHRILLFAPSCAKLARTIIALRDSSERLCVDCRHS